MGGGFSTHDLINIVNIHTLKYSPYTEWSVVDGYNMDSRKVIYTWMRLCLHAMKYNGLSLIDLKKEYRMTFDDFRFIVRNLEKFRVTQGDRCLNFGDCIALIFFVAFRCNNWEVCDYILNFQIEKKLTRGFDGQIYRNEILTNGTHSIRDSSRAQQKLHKKYQKYRKENPTWFTYTPPPACKLFASDGTSR